MIIVRGIHKLSDILDKIMGVVIVLMLGLMVIVTGAQIICRIFFQSLSWSEELTRYLLIWSSMLGAGCVYKHGGHISVTVLQDVFPGGLKKTAQLFVHLACMILFILIFRSGILYYGKQGNQLSPSLRWPMRYVYIGITIGMAVLFVHALDAFLGLLTKKSGSEDKGAEK